MQKFKRIVALFAITFGVLLSSGVSASLYNYYQERGLSLPSVAERTAAAKHCGISSYTGSYSQNLALEACLRGDSLGASIPIVVALYEDSLATKLTQTATSTFTLVRGTDKQGRSLSGYYGFVIDEGTTNEEFFLVTCSGITCTINTRGIDIVDGETNVPTLQHEHRRAAIAKITNFPQLAILSRILNGEETTPGGLTFGTGTIYGATTALLSSQTSSLANVEYVNNVATSGAPNASTVTKGLAEEATNAEVEAGTAAGSQARLFVNPGSWLEYADTHFSNNLAVGENVTAFNILYISSTGKYMIAHGNVQSEIDKIAGVTFETVTATNYPRVYKSGSVIYGTSGMTTGSLVYLSDTGTASTTPGTIRKVLGVALGTNVWDFNPMVEQTGVNPTSAVSNTIPISNASSTLNPRWLGNAFGNCSDGNVTTTASTTLTRDMHYNNWYVSSTVVVNTGGYQIFACGAITIGTNATTTNGGNNAVAASGATKGTKGAATTAGSLPASTAGQDGSDGAGPIGAGAAGTAGTSRTYSVVSSAAVASAAGGTGGGQAGGATGAVGTATLENARFGVKFTTTSLVSGQEMSAFNILSIFGVLDEMLTPAPGVPSGGAGGVNGSGGDKGGASAGSPSSGGPVLMAAPSIVNSGAIISLGGNGAKGGDSNAASNGGGGACSSGADGGVVALIYNTFSGNAPLVTGGTAGAVGLGSGGGANSGACSAGNAGKIFKIKI